MTMMFLLLLLLSALLAELGNSLPQMGQNVGLAPRPEDLKFPKWFNRTSCSLARNRPSTEKVTGTKSLNQDEFKVTLNLHEYKPNEISVKVENRSLIVEAKLEKGNDRCHYSKQFVKEYSVPEQVDIDKVKCKLYTDGVLILTAPVKKLTESKKKDMVVPIEQKNKPTIRGGKRL